MDRVVYAYNAVGSVVANTDQQGFVIRENDFDAYGNQVRTQDWTSDNFPVEFGGSSNDLLFSTKERDFSTGLDYFGFRYYDAVLGKFTTRDPSGYPDGPNNYLYVNNNPINSIDPLGLEEGTKEEELQKIITVRKMSEDLADDLTERRYRKGDIIFVTSSDENGVGSAPEAVGKLAKTMKMKVHDLKGKDATAKAIKEHLRKHIDSENDIVIILTHRGMNKGVGIKGGGIEGADEVQVTPKEIAKILEGGTRPALVVLWACKGEKTAKAIAGVGGAPLVIHGGISTLPGRSLNGGVKGNSEKFVEFMDLLDKSKMDVSGSVKKYNDLQDDENRDISTSVNLDGFFKAAQLILQGERTDPKEKSHAEKREEYFFQKRKDILMGGAMDSRIPFDTAKKWVQESMDKIKAKHYPNP